MVESNIIGVIVANMDGAIAEANDAFLRMVGYSQQDLLALCGICSPTPSILHPRAEEFMCN